MSRRNRMLMQAIAGGALLSLAISLGRAAELLPDPTRPPAASLLTTPATEQDAREKLELRAILHADDRRFAVINGRRLQVADRIAGAEILTIEVDRVRLRRNGELVELELVAPAFKNARRTRKPLASRSAESANASKPDDLLGAMR